MSRGASSRSWKEGGNVTIDTLRKVVAQLPNLREMHLGGVTVLRAARQRHGALGDLIDAATRLLRLFDAPGLAAETEEARLERFRRIDAQIDARRPPLGDEY